MGGVGDRHSKIKRQGPFLSDQYGGQCNIIFACGDTGEEAGPGDDLLIDLEWRRLSQHRQKFVVETGRLAILDEFERGDVANNEAELYDLIVRRFRKK